MTKLYRFNNEGMKQVRSLIDTLTVGIKKGSHGVPVSQEDLDTIAGMVHDDELTELVSNAIEIDTKKRFASSFELGEYLTKQLKLYDGDSIDAGVWSWLSILYIEQLLQKRKGQPERFIIGRSYRYVFEEKERLRYYRHLVFMPYYLVGKLGSDSYIFLHSPPFESGEFLAQAQKDEVVSNRNIISMCAKYYFNMKTRKFAPGFTAKKEDSRSLRWLVQTIVPQLMINYDVRICEPDALYKLLPQDYRDNSLLSKHIL